jgi:RNA-splicing ligase RtcB
MCANIAKIMDDVAKDDMDSTPVALDARTQEGQDYIAAMKLAGRHAYAGRDWVCDRVTKILGSRILDSVHNHHNFAWRETHQGKDLWAVHKGATSAFPRQRDLSAAPWGSARDRFVFFIRCARWAWRWLERTFSIQQGLSPQDSVLGPCGAVVQRDLQGSS